MKAQSDKIKTIRCATYPVSGGERGVGRLENGGGGEVLFISTT